MPKMINRKPPKKVICLSEILPAINLPPMTAIAAQIACRCGNYRKSYFGWNC